MVIKVFKCKGWVVEKFQVINVIVNLFNWCIKCESCFDNFFKFVVIKFVFNKCMKYINVVFYKWFFQ